jgi:hypothetical protein
LTREILAIAESVIKLKEKEAYEKTLSNEQQGLKEKEQLVSAIY